MLILLYASPEGRGEPHEWAELAGGLSGGQLSVVSCPLRADPWGFCRARGRAKLAFLQNSIAAEGVKKARRHAREWRNSQHLC